MPPVLATTARVARSARDAENQPPSVRCQGGESNVARGYRARHGAGPVRRASTRGPAKPAGLPAGRPPAPACPGRRGQRRDLASRAAALTSRPPRGVTPGLRPVAAHPHVAPPPAPVPGEVKEDPPTVRRR